MDMTESIAPKTDQINAADLTDGPITVTINRVTEGPPEQPFNFHMTETPGRAYRPSKSMRRVMVNAWGKDPSAYVGHSLTLYRNAATKFGSELLGGIEISHLSHIERPLTLPLTATRGKRKAFTVKPIPASRDWLTELATTDGDLDLIKALGTAAKNGGASADVMGKIMTAYRTAEAAGKSVEAAAEEGAE